MTVKFQVRKWKHRSSHIAASSAIANSAPVYINWTLLCIFFVSIVLHCQPAGAVDLPDFKGLIADKGKAVVKVTVTAKDSTETDIQSLPSFNEEDMPEFFRRFFEDLPSRPDGRPPPGNPTEGFGSGFVLSADGYVVTNAHVIKDAASIIVSFPDRRQFDATVVGADERTDVALIKIEATGLPALSLGDSNNLKVGQWVLAIGSPFGFEYTATQGIVSALARSLPNDTYVPFIQTDVAVNPGNSGGPLFDLDGNVIGVNSQIFSRSGGYMGLSFAIPANVVESVTRQIREKGYVSRGWLGVGIQEVNQALADSFGLDKPVGALVAEVTAGSAAEEGGIQTGDIIVSFNSHDVSLSSDLAPLVGSADVGRAVEVDVLRDRVRLTLTVVIKELDENREAASDDPRPMENSALGMVLAPMNDQQRRELGLVSGVIVSEIDANGIAAKAGIEKGDIVVSVGVHPVTSPVEFSGLMERTQSGDAVAVLVQRESNSLFIPLTMP